MPAKKKISPDETTEPVTPAVPAAEPPADSIVEQATMFAKPVPPPALAQSVPPTPPVAPVVPTVQPLSPGDERTWAMFSHLSVLLNLVTGFGGPIAAFIIYLVYKDRSRYVAYQSLQSAIFQAICWFGSGVLIGAMWAFVGLLSAILIGIVLIPFAILFTLLFGLLPLASLIYGIIGSIQTNQGQDFKYWLVGDWVRGTLTGH